MSKENDLFKNTRQRNKITAEWKKEPSTAWKDAPDGEDTRYQRKYLVDGEAWEKWQTSHTNIEFATEFYEQGYIGRGKNIERVQLAFASNPIIKQGSRRYQPPMFLDGITDDMSVDQGAPEPISATITQKANGGATLIGKALRRKEKIRPVDVAEAKEKLADNTPLLIKKSTRFRYKGHDWKVEEYLKPHEGTFTAEVQVDGRSDEAKLPGFVSEQSEVTTSYPQINDLILTTRPGFAAHEIERAWRDIGSASSHRL